LSVASVFVFRRSRPNWTRLPAVSFAYPLIPLLYILVGTCMMVYGFIGQPVPAFAAFGTVIAGALVYRLVVLR
jgi:hypothetical protein